MFTRLPHSAKRGVGGGGGEGPVVARGDGVDARGLLPVGLGLDLDLDLDLTGLLGARRLFLCDPCLCQGSPVHLACDHNTRNTSAAAFRGNPGDRRFASLS